MRVFEVGIYCLWKERTLEVHLRASLSLGKPVKEILVSTTGELKLEGPLTILPNQNATKIYENIKEHFYNWNFNRRMTVKIY